MAVLIKWLFGQSKPYQRANQRDLEAWSQPDYGTVRVDGLKSPTHEDDGDQMSRSLLGARVNGLPNGGLSPLERTASGSSSMKSTYSSDSTGGGFFCFRFSARTISDATIGLSDGLTVPFALTAGLSGLGSVRVVVLGGLAELVAGAISMGLGGWMGARSEAQSEAHQAAQTHEMCDSDPEHATSLVATSLRRYGLLLTPSQEQSVRSLPTAQLTNLVQHLQHGQLPVSSSRSEGDPSALARSPLAAALTIAGGYFVGGFVPLLPYAIVWSKQTDDGKGPAGGGNADVLLSLYWSMGVMAVALMLFGWAKVCCVSGWAGRDNVLAGARGALEMVVMGGAAAGAAVGLVRAIQA